MKSAELVLVDIGKMPKTHEGLKNWVISKSREADYLIYTDVAKMFKTLLLGVSSDSYKTNLAVYTFTAFNTLPQEFKSLYGIKETRLKTLILEFNLKFLKYTRPLLPPFFRLIAPAR